MSEKDNKNEVHIDYQGIINQMADKVISEFMSAIMPDEKTKIYMTGILAIHRKYGIDAVTSIKILQDMSKLVEEAEKHNEP